jgi:hypothetical protein
MALEYHLVNTASLTASKIRAAIPLAAQFAFSDPTPPILTISNLSFGGERSCYGKGHVHFRDIQGGCRCWQLAAVTVARGILGPIIYYAWLWGRAFVRFERRTVPRGQMGPIILMSIGLIGMLAFGVGTIWAVARSSPIATEKRYSACDVEGRLREIDAVHDVLSDLFQLSLEGVGLQFDTIIGIRAGNAHKTGQPLEAYRDRVNATFSKLTSLLNSRTFNDVMSVKNISTFDQASVSGNIEGYLRDLHALRLRTDKQLYLENDIYLGNLWRGVQALGQWETQCNQDLLTVRRKIENLPLAS